MEKKQAPWACVLRASTNTLAGDGVFSRDLKHRWVLEMSTTGQSGLSIQQITWGSIAASMNNEPIIWDETLDYETEWECGGFGANIWWPVRLKGADDESLSLASMIAIYEEEMVVNGEDPEFASRYVASLKRSLAASKEAYKAALVVKINASIAKYEVIDDPDDDYEVAFSAGHVDACETILDWVNS